MRDESKNQIARNLRDPNLPKNVDPCCTKSPRELKVLKYLNALWFSLWHI